MEQMQITRVEFPCKNCTERHIGCHSTCAKYLEKKKEADAILEAKKKTAAEQQASFAQRNRLRKTWAKSNGYGRKTNYGNIKTVVENRRDMQSKRKDD